MTVIDRYYSGWLHHQYIYFSPLFLKEMKTFLMAPSKCPGPSSLCLRCPRVFRGPPCPALRAPVVLQGDMIHDGGASPLCTLIYSESIGWARILSEKWSLALLFLLHPLHSFPGSCALLALLWFSADPALLKDGSKGDIVSAAALARVTGAALWDWLWKDIKVNTLLSNARLTFFFFFFNVARLFCFSALLNRAKVFRHCQWLFWNKTW